MIFFYFYTNFRWNIFLWSNWQYNCTGSDKGLAPNSRQAIIWNNDDKFADAYMRHSTSMS